MKKYVISVISTQLGSHELHLAQCSNLPKHVNELGEYDSFIKALAEVNKILPQVHVCPYCISKNQRGNS